MGKGGEVVVLGGGPRRHIAAEAEADEGSAKSLRPASVPPAATATATAATAAEKKTTTKKVMKRLTQEYVDFVLAKDPKLPDRPEPKGVSEECRRESARAKEIIGRSHDLIRSIQDYYRRELATKGYVEVETAEVEEVSVSDDDDDDEF